MQARLSKEIVVVRTRKPIPAEGGLKEQFRTRFRRTLCKCLQKGFRMEECFGLIWEEALEVAPLAEADQGELYEELLAWAKDQRKFRVVAASRCGSSGKPNSSSSSR